MIYQGSSLDVPLLSGNCSQRLAILSTYLEWSVLMDTSNLIDQNTELYVRADLAVRTFQNGGANSPVILLSLSGSHHEFFANRRRHAGTSPSVKCP